MYFYVCICTCIYIQAGDTGMTHFYRKSHRLFFRAPTQLWSLFFLGSASCTLGQEAHSMCIHRKYNRLFHRLSNLSLRNHSRIVLLAMPFGANTTKRSKDAEYLDPKQIREDCSNPIILRLWSLGLSIAIVIAISSRSDCDRWNHKSDCDRYSYTWINKECPSLHVFICLLFACVLLCQRQGLLGISVQSSPWIAI